MARYLVAAGGQLEHMDARRWAWWCIRGMQFCIGTSGAKNNNVTTSKRQCQKHYYTQHCQRTADRLVLPGSCIGVEAASPLIANLMSANLARSSLHRPPDALWPHSFPLLFACSFPDMLWACASTSTQWFHTASSANLIIPDPLGTWLLPASVCLPAAYLTRCGRARCSTKSPASSG
jgi:hypothetical protein